MRIISQRILVVHIHIVLVTVYFIQAGFTACNIMSLLLQQYYRKMARGEINSTQVCQLCAWTVEGYGVGVWLHQCVRERVSYGSMGNSVFIQHCIVCIQSSILHNHEGTSLKMDQTKDKDSKYLHENWISGILLSVHVFLFFSLRYCFQLMI